MATLVKKKHLFVPNEFIRTEQYTSPSAGGGGGGEEVPVRDRVTHANRLLGQLQQAAQAVEMVVVARNEAGVHREGGLYVQFTGTPLFDLPFESLGDERAGVALLNAKSSEAGDVATIFIPANRLHVIERKIAAYRDSDVSDGGKPRNQKLVANIDSVALAQVDALWTDDPDVLPAHPDDVFWAEVWLRKEEGLESPDEVTAVLRMAGLEQGVGQIEFPERLVLPVHGSRRQFGSAMLLLNSIAELRRVKDTAAFFVGESAEGQLEWIDSLLQRIVSSGQESPPRVCLLDTGVNDHPLLSPTMAPGGKHVNDPTWGPADQNGHGTSMAGLCMFGDLSEALQSQGPFVVDHQLESVKVLRWDGDNQGRLPGDITREGIGRAEVSEANVNRAFVMALSSSDTRDRGRPSTWSSMVDKLASGADDDTRRLIFVAGGNVARDLWVQYPQVNSTEGIHDPGQAWNALTVGAYTDKDSIDAATYPGWTVVASAGDLGPSSSTSSTWRSGWPVKPDIVMEGGNAANDTAGSVDTVVSLDLLTTNHQFLARPLQVFGDTSAATALAGRFAAQLFSQYPALWPETVRALMVHSAEWTQAMLDRFVGSDAWGATKTDVRNLMRHCGHGVPNMETAIWSVDNALTLVCQSELQPFDEKFDVEGKRDGHCTKDMNLHLIPWPKEALEALEETEVELRVVLSYFIEPNPAERGWSGRYRYQSHGLRFAVKKGSENLDQFRHRVNAYARQVEGGERGTDSDGWLVGDTTRNLGSLHADRWRGTARALAERGVLAVFPTLGWWRERPKHQRWNHKARYALVVSIRAPTADVDLFASIANQIAIPVEVGGV